MLLISKYRLAINRAFSALRPARPTIAPVLAESTLIVAVVFPLDFSLILTSFTYFESRALRINCLGSSEYSTSSIVLPIDYWILFIDWPFLPIARPISPLLTKNMTRPTLLSIIQSRAIAPVTF